MTTSAHSPCGSGRLGWAAASDYLGRKNTYFLFGLSIPILAALPSLTTYLVSKLVWWREFLLEMVLQSVFQNLDPFSSAVAPVWYRCTPLSVVQLWSSAFMVASFQVRRGMLLPYSGCLR